MKRLRKIFLAFIPGRPCCICQKWVWPWKQSAISFSPIHLKCHSEILSESMKRHPELAGCYAREFSEFASATGRKSELDKTIREITEAGEKARELFSSKGLTLDEKLDYHSQVSEWRSL
jgi:hypothetical protein